MSSAASSGTGFILHCMDHFLSYPMDSRAGPDPSEYYTFPGSLLPRPKIDPVIAAEWATRFARIRIQIQRKSENRSVFPSLMLKECKPNTDQLNCLSIEQIGEGRNRRSCDPKIKAREHTLRTLAKSMLVKPFATNLSDHLWSNVFLMR
jgi:hypothetical protein